MGCDVTQTIFIYRRVSNSTKNIKIFTVKALSIILYLQIWYLYIIQKKRQIIQVLCEIDFSSPYKKFKKYYYEIFKRIVPLNNIHCN